MLIENFRPDTREGWGLGYEALSAINPRLVMIRVSGYGQTGPYARSAGYGAIGEAMGDLRYVVGDPSNPPSRAGLSIGGHARRHLRVPGRPEGPHVRGHIGRGQMLDSAIYEAVLAVMENLVTEDDGAGYIRERTGSFLPSIAPSNVYPTRSGVFVLIAANQDSVFRRLAADAPIKARDTIVEIPHPAFGSLEMQNVMPKLSETPGRVATPGPELGEHDHEILAGLLGYGADQIEALARDGIVGAPAHRAA